MFSKSQPNWLPNFSRLNRICILFGTFVGAMFILLLFVTAGSVLAGEHFDDFGPYEVGIGFWGCVWVTGEAQCVTDAHVTFSRNDVSVTGCSFVGTRQDAVCTNGNTETHEAEEFPYYGIGVSSLVSDVVDAEGILLQPVTLEVSVVYTASDNTVYSGVEAITVDADSFDRSGEYRLDLTVGDVVQTCPNGPPIADCIEVYENTVVENGRLTLSNFTSGLQNNARYLTTKNIENDTTILNSESTTFTHFENFDNHDNKYPEGTTAIWNTFDSRLEMPRLPGTSDQHYPSVTVDDLGNSYVVWQDERNQNYDIYAQKFDADGNYLWSEDIQVNDHINSLGITTPIVCLDADGNIVVIWQDRGIYMQKLDQSGSKLWLENKRVDKEYLSGYPKNPDAVLDESTGEIIVVWHDQQSDDSNENIYLQRIDSNGNRHWEHAKQVNTNNTVDHVSPAVGVDNQGHAFVVWRDDREGNNDIWAQKVHPVGLSLWGEELRVNSDNNTYSQQSPAILTTPQGDNYVVWIEKTSIYTSGGSLYAQKFDRNKTKQWTEDIQIGSSANSANIQLSNDGHVLVTWHWYLTAPSGGSAIYIQKLHPEDGSEVWPDIAVDRSVGGYGSHDFAIHDNGKINIVWNVSRDGQYDINMQSLD